MFIVFESYPLTPKVLCVPLYSNDVVDTVGLVTDTFITVSEPFVSLSTISVNVELIYLSPLAFTTT